MNVRNYILLLWLTLSLAFARLGFSQSTDMVVNDTLMGQFVTAWEGTPYVYGGTSRKGIDCSALTQKAYLFLFGVEIPRRASDQFAYLQRVEVPLPGDLIFFRSYVSPSGWHVGIWLGNGFFLHAANRKSGVVISNTSDGTYSKRIMGWRRASEGTLSTPPRK